MWIAIRGFPSPGSRPTSGSRSVAPERDRRHSRIPACPGVGSRGGCMTKRTILVVLAAATLIMGACGGDDDGGSANGGGNGGDGGGGLQITASGTAFDTDSLSAPAGEVEVTL